jgi:hypothetical protein
MLRLLNVIPAGAKGPILLRIQRSQSYPGLLIGNLLAQRQLGSRDTIARKKLLILVLMLILIGRENGFGPASSARVAH